MTGSIRRRRDLNKGSGTMNTEFGSEPHDLWNTVALGVVAVIVFLMIWENA